MKCDRVSFDLEVNDLLGQHADSTLDLQAAHFDVAVGTQNSGFRVTVYQATLRKLRAHFEFLRGLSLQHIDGDLRWGWTTPEDAFEGVVEVFASRSR